MTTSRSAQLTEHPSKSVTSAVSNTSSSNTSPQESSPTVDDGSFQGLIMGTANALGGMLFLFSGLALGGIFDFLLNISFTIWNYLFMDTIRDLNRPQSGSQTSQSGESIASGPAYGGRIARGIGTIAYGFFTLMFVLFVIVAGFGLSVCWFILTLIFGAGNASKIIVILAVFLVILFLFNKQREP